MIKTRPPVSGRPARLQAMLVTFVAVFLGGTAISESATDADNPVDLEAYRGKVVLLDFWASWCVPCRSSFPWMNDMQEKYGDDGLVVIAVNLDNELRDAAGFLERNPAGFKIAYDTERAMARSFGVDSMPNSFLIDRDGRVRARHRGFRVADSADYEAAIIELLDAGPTGGASR